MAQSTIMEGGSLKGLPAAERAARQGGRLPVEEWNPPFRGDLDMRIAADGVWYYQGTPIRRERLVRLFAGILRREGDGSYHLVTPVEDYRIAVDDAPFLAVALASEGTGRDRTMTFCTNVGDEVRAGPEHPIRFDLEPERNGLKPYVHVRGGLEALVTRALTYDLLDLGEEHLVDGEARFGIWSGGAFFDIAPAGALAT